MASTNENSYPAVFVGVLGIFILLVGLLGYALWESGRAYQPGQIDQFVEEQAEQTGDLATR